VPRSAEDVEGLCGRYETVAAVITVAPHGDGVSLEVVERPEVMAELGVEPELEPPVPFLFLAGEGDRIVCLTPPYRGTTGFFVRDGSGTATALNAFGRHCVRE
jgi:hypothetical protein